MSTARLAVLVIAMLLWWAVHSGMLKWMVISLVLAYISG